MHYNIHSPTIFLAGLRVFLSSQPLIHIKGRYQDVVPYLCGCGNANVEEARLCSQLTDKLKKLTPDQIAELDRLVDGL